MASSPPNSRTNLDKAIQRLYGQRARFGEAATPGRSRRGGTPPRRARPPKPSHQPLTTNHCP